MERPPRTNLVGGWRGEERTEFVVLADELLGATTSELLEVAQLPLKSGQLFQTREGQDMPGGSEGEEGREEGRVCCSYGALMVVVVVALL